MIKDGVGYEYIFLFPAEFSEMGDRHKDQLWADLTERRWAEDVVDTRGDQRRRTDTGNYFVWGTNARPYIEEVSDWSLGYQLTTALHESYIDTCVVSVPR